MISSSVDYTEALYLNPTVVNAWFNQSRAYVGQGKYDLAIADLDELLRLDPENDLALLLRGLISLIFKEQGETQRAIDDWTQVRDLTSNPELRKIAEESLSELQTS